MYQYYIKLYLTNQFVNKQLQMGYLPHAGKISYLWGAILYQWASSVFLITVTDPTLYLSAIGYLIGSALFALSDVFNIIQSQGFNKYMNCAFCFADSILVIGSIFFFPTLDRVIVGNWLFQIAGWLNFTNHTIKFVQLYKNPSQNWRVELVSRIFNFIGTTTFILGNILLINNAKANFIAGFILFTTGSIGFTVGGSLAFVQVQKKREEEQSSSNIILNNNTNQPNTSIKDNN